jgi:hypothetical protein
MSSPDRKKMSLKQKIFHELVEYWINVGYPTNRHAIAAYRRETGQTTPATPAK